MQTETISALPTIASRYLEHRLPSAGQVRVRDMKRGAIGSSRAMWFFHAEWDGEAEISHELAFRADESTCFRDEYEEGLDREFKVYQSLHETGIPVPRNYWYETDPAWIGEPFVIRELLPGRSNLQNDPPGFQRRVLENFVDVLAAQHTLDWEKAGLSFLGAPDDPVSGGVALVDKWDRIAQSELLQPLPMASAVVTWLRAHLPTKADRISLNQGQVGPGQFLFDDEARIVAQLDWEQAFLGDPMSDMAYFVFQVRPLVGDFVDDLLARYTERSGIPIREENLLFYSVFQSFWAVAHCWTGLNRFANNQHRQLQTLQLGLRVPQFFVRLMHSQISAGIPGG